MKFSWVPSHVNIPPNEKIDVLAKCGSEKDEIDVTCHLSLKEIRSIVKKEQYWLDGIRMMKEHAKSSTFYHYDKVSDYN